MSFTKIQLKYMLEMMEMLHEKLSNNSCNDYSMPVTDENVEYCTNMMFVVGDPNDEELNISFDGKTIYLMDWEITAYCRYLIKKELDKKVKAETRKQNLDTQDKSGTWVVVLKANEVDRSGNTFSIDTLRKISMENPENYKLEGNTLYQKVDMSKYQLVNK